jgi:hypothetical protein
LTADTSFRLPSALDTAVQAELDGGGRATAGLALLRRAIET